MLSHDSQRNPRSLGGEDVNTPATNIVKRVPVTAQHRVFLSGPTINSYFPVIFSNGNVLEELSCSCAQCGKKFSPESLHGVITRPLESVVLVESVGVCTPCSLLTPFTCRIRDDLSLEWMSKGGWLRSDRRGTRPLISATSTREPGALLQAVGASWILFLILMLPMVISLFKIARMGR